MALRKFTSKEIGNNIRQIRVELGQTQEEFGRNVGGYSQDTAAKWEAGQVPHAPVLMRIAELSRRSVDWILGREDAGKREPEKMEELIANVEREMKELKNLASKRRKSAPKSKT
jgi:transcriptional regulator with XRE-family HTH domain